MTDEEYYNLAYKVAEYVSRDFNTIKTDKDDLIQELVIYSMSLKDRIINFDNLVSYLNISFKYKVYKIILDEHKKGLYLENLLFESDSNLTPEERLSYNKTDISSNIDFKLNRKGEIIVLDNYVKERELKIKEHNKKYNYQWYVNRLKEQDRYEEHLKQRRDKYAEKKDKMIKDGTIDEYFDNKRKIQRDKYKEKIDKLKKEGKYEEYVIKERQRQKEWRDKNKDKTKKYKEKYKK